MRRKPIRQGDVLLVPVDPPKSARRVEDLNGLRIPGENSGHVHVLQAEVHETNVGQLLYVPDPTAMRTLHTDTSEPWPERHADVGVDAGWWQPVPQREYTPSSTRRRGLVD